MSDSILDIPSSLGFLNQERKASISSTSTLIPANSQGTQQLKNSELFDLIKISMKQSAS